MSNRSGATSTARIGRIIASRELTDAKDPKRRIFVSLGVPRRIADDRWECAFSIEGLASAPIRGRAPGGDSLQALLLGAGDVRRHLMESGATFEWDGDSLFGGDTGGIPRSLPLGMGKEFYDRLDAVISREIKRTLNFRARPRKKYSATSKTRIGIVAGSRKLTDANHPRKRIMVAVGLPRQVAPFEWQCKVHIDGLNPEPVFEQVSGMDSLHALLLGVEFLRFSLKRSPRQLAWLGDSLLLTAGGIPRQVPADFGEEFDKRVEQLLAREKRRFREFRARILRAHLAEASKRTTPSRERASSKPRRSR